MPLVQDEPRSRRSTAGLVVLSLLLLTLAACSAPAGLVRAGALAPPDGAGEAQRFFDTIAAARTAVALPPVPRDPALDDLAGRALPLVGGSLPEGTSVLAHLRATAPLPPGLEYGVGFEEMTPGVDDRMRALAHRRGPAAFSEPLLAADPALDGMGWAATGPWSVLVLRARPLRPADAPAVQAALAGGVERARPALHREPRLDAVAAEIVADGRLGLDDAPRYGRAGGVPVHLASARDDVHLPTEALGATLRGEGPGTLREPWLGRLGVAVDITAAGAVTFIVLATGDADRAALRAQIAGAEPKAAELVNRARAEAALPPVRLDAALVTAARQLLAESVRRGCFVRVSDPTCPGGTTPRAASWYSRQSTWVDGEAAYGWDVAPAGPGDDRLTRFGAAATLGPDGTVWSTLVLA